MVLVGGYPIRALPQRIELTRRHDENALKLRLTRLRRPTSPTRHLSPLTGAAPPRLNGRDGARSCCRPGHSDQDLCKGRRIGSFETEEQGRDEPNTNERHDQPDDEADGDEPG